MLENHRNSRPGKHYLLNAFPRLLHMLHQRVLILLRRCEQVHLRTVALQAVRIMVMRQSLPGRIVEDEIENQHQQGYPRARQENRQETFHIQWLVYF